MLLAHPKTGKRSVEKMKTHCTVLKSIIRVFVCILLILSSHTVMAQRDESPDPARSLSEEKDGDSQRFVSIDFTNVDINVFIKFISELTGKNFVVDEKVRGQVTIISPAKISLEEAYKVFESVLEVHGFTTVEAGEVVKIIPSPDARMKNIETRLREEAGSPEDKVVTQLIPLRYADPNEIQKLFSSMISKSSVMLAYQPTNTLIVTDVYSNITRLMRILKTIDIPGIGQEISVIPIDYASTKELVKILDSIFKPIKKPAKGAQVSQVVFVPDERTNSVVILASEDDTRRILELIAVLDKDMPLGAGKVRVYYLEHAVAEDLAKVLQTLPQKKAVDEKGKQTAPLVSGEVSITPDKATNSLIITAEKDEYLVIEEVIKKLDIPRAMVYIEALFMEVKVNKDIQLGIDWTALGKTNLGSDNRPAGFGGGFGTVIPGDLVAPPPGGAGFSMGIVTELNIPGVGLISNIGAIINAYKNDKDVNILTTPQILTTDNQEASIVIAENIPYQTQTSTSASSDTYNSFEYRDVGKILKITPSISKGRMVRLAISLEVSVAPPNPGLQPTTLKRTVDTTAIVEDGHTIVIGGLIEEDKNLTVTKVPCLGDVPIVGWAFKTMTDSGGKTNLYVFITPHVIANPPEAEEIYRKKKDQLDETEAHSIKMYKKEKAIIDSLSDEPAE